MAWLGDEVPGNRSQEQELLSQSIADIQLIAKELWHGTEKKIGALNPLHSPAATGEGGNCSWASIRASGARLGEPAHQTCSEGQRQQPGNSGFEQ